MDSDKENEYNGHENNRKQSTSHNAPVPEEFLPPQGKQQEEVVNVSKIPVPESIHFLGSRSLYLRDLQEKVYDYGTYDEFHVKKYKRRAVRRRGGETQDIETDSDGLLAEVESGEEEDEVTDYGPPGILHERRRRRLSRKASSEFGASSIELLGPGETLDTDESDGSGELMEYSGEGENGGESSAGEEDGEENALKKAIAKQFSRFPETKVVGKKPVKTKREERGDREESRGRGRKLERRSERESESPRKAADEKRDRQWDRVDARKKSSSKSKSRHRSSPPPEEEDRRRRIGEENVGRTPSRSPARSPAKKQEKREDHVKRYAEVSPRRSSGVPGVGDKKSPSRRSDSRGDADKRSPSKRRSDTSATDKRSPARRYEVTVPDKKSPSRRYEDSDKKSPSRRHELPDKKSPSRRYDVTVSDKKSPARRYDTTVPDKKSPSRRSETRSDPDKRSPSRRRDATEPDKKSSYKRIETAGDTTSPRRPSVASSTTSKKSTASKTSDDKERRRGSQVSTGRPSSKIIDGPPGLTVRDTSDEKWRVKSTSPGKSEKKSSSRSRRNEPEINIRIKPPAPRTLPTAPRAASIVNLNEMDEVKMTEEQLRDSAAGMRLLQLCQMGEWYGVDGHLRYFEKRVSTGAIKEPDPLKDLRDEQTGWTPLMYAVRDSKIPMIERMMDLGCNINDKNLEGHCPIHVGALHAREDTIKFLIENGADPFVVTDKSKQNILHVAASRKSGNTAAIMKILLGVMPPDARLAKDENGDIPLFIAVRNGLRLACQELLHELAQEQVTMRGCPPKEDTPLIMASRNKDVETIRVLTDAGADVNKSNGQGQTPLHIAAEVGDENLCKFFYLCKANPHLMDNEDRTPIFLAAMNGNTQLVDLLADKFKVSVFERARDGSTLMHIASLHGHPETAMALFRKGVPLQMPNKMGARAIHIAARNGHHQMIARLLEKGEKVDAVTNDNFTALHIAVEAVKPNVVETLLGYGAQVHVKGGKDHETPLHITARVKGGETCAQMLLKSGAEPNITMENGESPLHVAARCGRLKIVEILLRDGANPQQKAKDGDTALHFACRYGHFRVVQALLEHVKTKKSANECTLYINMVTTKGESAMHYAARLNEGRIKAVDEELEMEKKEIGTNIVKLLLDGGASVSRLTKDVNESCFHYACKEGNNDILKEMLSRLGGVESQRALNRQNNKGWSPLLIACRRGHTSVVETLLEFNARVDVFDTEGRSGLHLAAENGYQEICGILLNAKAFINAKSRVGLTALHLAAMKGFTKLCLFLIQDHGAAVDALTLKKQTPLHLAAESGQLKICSLLMGLNASPDATDDKGQKPIHLAAQHNHADVIKLFLKHSPQLGQSFTKDGSTCAHLAAMQGSIAVLEELMKFDKQGVINARNRSTDATALQLAAEGGHAELVKTLLDAAASASDENRMGYTAAHLAAKNGHMNVLEALRTAQEDSINLTSRKLGMSALHIAAFYGQTETVRDLLQYIPATSITDPPISLATAFIKELGTESGLTPLHMAAYSGEENVVRLLLNFEGVQVDAPTTNLGFNPLHLACGGGHTSVVGLLLSRSSELLESKDASGKTGLHIASSMGHKQMVEVLLGQGAEIDAIDKELWTPLICAAQAGHVDVVKLLVESGASPLAKTSKGQSAIWFAAAENNVDVLSYLMKKEHDTYGLLEDKDFVYNLTVCGKNLDNEPIDEFVLSSPAPLEIAAKMSSFLVYVSTREKERAKDLIAASEHCSAMATELLALAAGAETASKVLGAVDRKNVEFLDVLIECEQKEVVAHTVVQRYLQEIWVGRLVEWPDWQLLLVFLACVFIPPVWITMSMPFGPSYNNIPIVKFMSYLTSHIHLMVLLSLTAATPIVPVLPIRTDLIPFWFEWMLCAWLAGLLIAEITNPSDKSGLGFFKICVLLFSYLALLVHLAAFFVPTEDYGTVLYIRDQLFGLGILSACIQILDFLSFHYLFGPWAIIIGNLMKDLARFIAVLMIFMLGFSLVCVSLNHPVHERREKTAGESVPSSLTGGTESGILLTPLDAFEMLFFAMFGLADWNDLKIEVLGQPNWTIVLFKIFLAVYLLVSVIVLINLLIAMMSDTYQRIEQQSDIEWKYGLAKLIRNMQITTATASPLNLFVDWGTWIYRRVKVYRKPKNKLAWDQDPSMALGGGLYGGDKKGEEGTEVQLKWKKAITANKSQKGQDAHMRMSVNQLVPQGEAGIGDSTLSAGENRIESVTDWRVIAKKYYTLIGKEEPVEEKAGGDKSGSRQGSGSTMGSSMMMLSKQNL